jgi:hypothetical protein
VWPHNPQTGWSYCVTIPSWIAQTPEAGATSDNFLKSIVVSIIYLLPSCFLHFSQGSLVSQFGSCLQFTAMSMVLQFCAIAK